MKRLGLAAAFVLVLFVATVSAQETLQSGKTEGTLGSEPVEYTLNATAGQPYLISVTSADFDTFVQVTDADGNLVASDDDSGVDRNAVTLFIPETDGAYTVAVSSFNDGTGPYSIEVIEELQALSVGEPAPITVGDGSIFAFSFESAGGAVNIDADSGGQVDTSLILTNSLGSIVDTADDTEGIDPALRRTMLDEGTYYVIVIPYNADVSGDVSVSVATTELQVLGAEPLTFTFDADVREDVASWDVVEGTVYLVTVELDTPGDFSLYVEATAQDQFSFGQFSFSQGLGGTFRYVADLTGSLTANISGGFLGDDETVTYTITVVPEE